MYQAVAITMLSWNVWTLLAETCCSIPESLAPGSLEWQHCFVVSLLYWLPPIIFVSQLFCQRMNDGTMLIRLTASVATREHLVSTQGRCFWNRLTSRTQAMSQALNELYRPLEHDVAIFALRACEPTSQRATSATDGSAGQRQKGLQVMGGHISWGESWRP